MGKKMCVSPSSLLDFNLYPLSHIHFTHLLRFVTELCTCPRSSRGEDWYIINPPPMIIRQRAWDLNEGYCLEEYMFISFLSHMGMTVLLLGEKDIDSKMGEGRVDGRGNFRPASSLLDFNLYPLSHIFFPRLLRVVTEFRISSISSRGVVLE